MLLEAFFEPALFEALFCISFMPAFFLFFLLFFSIFSPPGVFSSIINTLFLIMQKQSGVYIYIKINLNLIKNLQFAQISDIISCTEYLW